MSLEREADGLLPCPFCGVAPLHDPEQDDVFCGNEGCIMMDVGNRTVPAERWNTRTPPPQEAPAPATEGAQREAVDKERSDAFDAIERYLRNSLFDDEYQEYSAYLQKAWDATPTDASGGVTWEVAKAIIAASHIWDMREDGPRRTAAERQDFILRAANEANEALEAADRARKPDTRRVASGEEADYVLVPKVPTSAMVDAGREAMSPEKFVSHARAIWTWQAMVKASPTRATHRVASGESIAQLSKAWQRWKAKDGVDPEKDDAELSAAIYEVVKMPNRAQAASAGECDYCASRVASGEVTPHMIEVAVAAYYNADDKAGIEGAIGDAIHAALSASPTRAQAASAGEPVAWMCRVDDGEKQWIEHCGKLKQGSFPVYAAPTDVPPGDRAQAASAGEPEETRERVIAKLK